MDNDRMYIGELSRRTGVSVKTIRYYEEFGILDKPDRTGSAYRVYGQGDVDKLLFVRQAKELGLRLSEIKDVMCCAQEGLEPCCRLVRDVFTKKIREYEHRIGELQTAKKRLEKKLKTWVKPHQAKTMTYAVCPQIEEGQKRKGGRKHVTAKG